VKFLIAESKKRGFPVSMHTNGLTLTDEMVEFLIDSKVDFVSVSIDAFSPEVFQDMRSSQKYDFVKDAVFRLLDKRGDSVVSRIGVSFSEEEENVSQKDEFVKYWIQYVDVVKVNYSYSVDKKILDFDVGMTGSKVPCREIYDQMIIGYDGSVRLCCLDGFGETNLGNVFDEGILNVWNGEKFSKIRKMHENDDLGSFPFCEGCVMREGFNMTEDKIEDNVLIRTSGFITFYNRIDRLENWSEGLKRRDLL
jgi:MoaA/NifB/PqqE/SkfB family radical SAM enzyme